MITIWKLGKKTIMIFRGLIRMMKVGTDKRNLSTNTICKYKSLQMNKLTSYKHLLWFVELVPIQNCHRRAPKWPRHSNSKSYSEILFDPCRDMKRNCSNGRSRFCSKNRRSLSSFRSIRCFVCCRTSPSHKWRFCRRWSLKGCRPHSSMQSDRQLFFVK